jgi:sugar phosphate permease
MLTLAGAAGASVNAASGRAVMSWFAPAQRGFALGIRQTAVPLGGAAAALFLPPAAAAGGVRAGLVVLAGG